MLDEESFFVSQNSPPLILPDLNEFPDETLAPFSFDLNVIPIDNNESDTIPSSLVHDPDENISRALIHSPNLKPRLTNTQRRAIFDFLISQSNNGNMKKGLVELKIAKFSVSRSTVYRIWQAGIECLKNDCPVDVSTKLPMRVGRKRVQIDFNQISEVPLRNRTNIRSLSVALKMSKSTVHRRIKEGAIRSHSNPLKPFLTEENKKTRLRYCVSMIDEFTVHSRPLFMDMYDTIHIDEKWFFMSKVSEKYYLHPQEEDPLRTCKSKRFITKVMFLVAVARPRITSGTVLFDGKIGVFPFIFKEPAKRNSKNRVVGTLETKAITNVTKEVMRSCLIQKVLPAIREKWPEDGSRIIYIQQDNARPHISVNDSDFVEEACKDGFDIRLRFQPPNSPDLNVLDLGFFRAIQCLQHEQSPTNIDELVSAVNKAFNDLPAEDLNRVFITLQSCMIEVMKVFGGFNYKIPHMNKERLIREGILPARLECDKNILSEVVSFLDRS